MKRNIEIIVTNQFASLFSMERKMFVSYKRKQGDGVIVLNQKKKNEMRGGINK